MPGRKSIEIDAQKKRLLTYVLHKHNLSSETVQSKLVSSSLLLLSGGAAFSIFARKTSIVSESHAEVNSSNLSGLEHSLCFLTREHNRGGEVRFLREERRGMLS